MSRNSLDLGELDDLVELPPHLPVGHAEDGAVEEDVLPAGQLRVEPGPDFEQAADSPAESNLARGRPA